MIASNFYDLLDSVVPGGALGHLDTAVIPDRKLYLTRISMDGLYGMHEYSKDERMYKYFEFEPFRNIEDTKMYLQKLVDRIGNVVDGREYMYWFINSIEDRKIIGSICLVEIDVYKGSAAWGYAISPDYWGRGHILEAQLLVVNYFFDVLKMHKLWGVTPVDNEPTISSVLSAGFQKEGILRDHYLYPNAVRKDGFAYSLLATDYYNTKEGERLETKTTLITFDRLRSIFEKVFGITSTSINESTSMRTVSNWDSLSHIMLISEIEKNTGYCFKPTEITKATSVKGILEILNV